MESEEAPLSVDIHLSTEQVAQQTEILMNHKIYSRKS